MKSPTKNPVLAPTSPGLNNALQFNFSAAPKKWQRITRCFLEGRSLNRRGLMDTQARVLCYWLAPESRHRAVELHGHTRGSTEAIDLPCKPPKEAGNGAAPTETE